MARGFLNLPVEIRLMIYENLLIHQDGPYIMASSYMHVDRTSREKPLGLSPAILRVNKQIHNEASPVLYSKNRFRFLNHIDSKDGGESPFMIHTTLTPNIAPFLSQIGHQATLLRHIAIMFPVLEVYNHYGQPTRAFLGDPLKPYKGHSEAFNLIRDTCTDLKTLELVISDPTKAEFHSTFDSSFEAWSGHDFIRGAYPYHLDYLDRLFKKINTLKEVLVHFQFHEKEEKNFQIARWQDQISMWCERGWNYRFTNMGNQNPHERIDEARRARFRALDAWRRRVAEEFPGTHFPVM